MTSSGTIRPLGYRVTLRLQTHAQARGRSSVVSADDCAPGAPHSLRRTKASQSHFLGARERVSTRTT